MARAARLSGADLDDDEFEEIEELIHEKTEHPNELVRSCHCPLSSFVVLISTLSVKF